MPAGDLSKKERQQLKLELQAHQDSVRAEAASWEEDDKRLKAKQQRAQQKTEKADAKLQTKLERRELEAEENAAIARQGSKKAQTSKMTQAEIARRQALMAASKAPARKPTKPSSNVVEQPKLEENRNREVKVVEASGLESILAALENGGGSSNYKEFEKATMERLRADKPGLSMSQLQAHVAKAWARSPENPKNARR